jgi:hypothetical protein
VRRLLEPALPALVQRKTTATGESADLRKQPMILLRGNSGDFGDAIANS